MKPELRPRQAKRICRELVDEMFRQIGEEWLEAYLRREDDEFESEYSDDYFYPFDDDEEELFNPEEPFEMDRPTDIASTYDQWWDYEP